MAIEEVVVEEWAILWLQSSRSFLIFWVTMFMTSTLGIIRLLSDFDKARKYRWYFLGFTVLYIIFMLMSSLSVYSVLNNYQMNRRFSIDGIFGEEIQKLAKNNSTIVDYLLCEDEPYMIKERINLWVYTLFFYILLYCVKLIESRPDLSLRSSLLPRGIRHLSYDLES